MIESPWSKVPRVEKSERDIERERVEDALNTVAIEIANAAKVAGITYELESSSRRSSIPYRAFIQLEEDIVPLTSIVDALVDSENEKLTKFGSRTRLKFEFQQKSSKVGQKGIVISTQEVS